MSRRFLVLANRSSGNFDPALFQTFLERIQRDATLALTEVVAWERTDFLATRERIELALARTDFDRVVVWGGDGTVSTAADALVGRPASLALVPTGTANLIAREVQVPLLLPDAIEVALHGASDVHLDAMAALGRTFFSHLSLGLYADLLERVDPAQKRRWGRLAYAAAGAAELWTHTARRYRIVIDGQASTVSASTVMVANLKHFGVGDWSWGDHIVPTDGRLDLCLLRPRRRRAVVRLARAMARGGFPSDPAVTYEPVLREVAVEALEGGALQVRGDGNLYRTERVEIRLVPRAVRVVCAA